MTRPGTEAQPLRVAIVGAGPTGFYATDQLFRQPELVVDVDLYDRVPTPYGLVRAGVAPDHQKIKAVTGPSTRSRRIPDFDSSAESSLDAT
jgi:ferredoxin--NADP+ reductase